MFYCSAIQSCTISLAQERAHTMATNAQATEDFKRKNAPSPQPDNPGPVAKRPRILSNPSCTSLKSLLEFWLSLSNLSKDRFLVREMAKSPEGWIQLSLFLTFKKVSHLQANITDLEQALTQLSLENIEMKKDQSNHIYIRFRGGLSMLETRLQHALTTEDARTVYVQTIPVSTTRENLSTVFDVFGKVAYIGIPRYPDGGAKGFAFVEYEREEDAQAVILTAKKKALHFDGRPLMAIPRAQWKQEKEEYKQRRRTRAAAVRLAEQTQRQRAESTETGDGEENCEQRQEGEEKKDDNEKHAKASSTTKDSDMDSLIVVPAFDKGLLLSVKGLAQATVAVNRQALYHVFEEFGPIAFIQFSGKNSDECVVRYMHRSGAKRAVEILNKGDGKVLGAEIGLEVLEGDRELGYWREIEQIKKMKSSRRVMKEQGRRERRVQRREMPRRKIEGQKKTK